VWCVGSVVCLKDSVEVNEFECVGDGAGLVDGKEKGGLDTIQTTVAIVIGLLLKQPLRSRFSLEQETEIHYLRSVADTIQHTA